MTTKTLLPPDGLEVATSGLINLAHEGFALAKKMRNKKLAAEIETACETMISAAVVVIRHEYAIIPTELVDRINFVSGQVDEAEARRDARRANSVMVCAKPTGKPARKKAR